MLAFILPSQVEEELMLNANLAKVAVKSQDAEFDSTAAEVLRQVLIHSRGQPPSHAVMREIIRSKFDSLEAVLAEN